MIYPLTRGLLGSMMLRHDHGVFMGAASRLYPFLSDTVQDTMVKVETIYHDLASCSPDEAKRKDPQLYEEMIGEGFYHPDREESYTAMLDESLRMEKSYLETLDSKNEKS